MPFEQIGQFSENELVEKAKKDEQAFRQLYDHYYPKIYGYIKKRVGHQETAQDLVSETFIKAYVNLNKFVYKGAPFSAWLYRIATNLIIDHYRKAKHYQTVDLEDYQEIPDNYQTDAQMIKIEQQNEVAAYLDVLPERERKAIELKFFAELGNNEIAKVLNISANLVGVLIFRALKKMKKFPGQKSLAFAAENLQDDSFDQANEDAAVNYCQLAAETAGFYLNSIYQHIQRIKNLAKQYVF